MDCAKAVVAMTMLCATCATETALSRAVISTLTVVQRRAISAVAMVLRNTRQDWGSTVITRADCCRLYEAAVCDRDHASAAAFLDALQDADAPEWMVDAARRYHDSFPASRDRAAGWRIMPENGYYAAYCWFGVLPPTTLPRR